MKFESSVKFQKGISYSSLTIVVLFFSFLYLTANRISEKPANSNKDESKQKIELQKQINEKKNNLVVQQNPVENNNVNLSKAVLTVANEADKKPEVRKASSRELGFDMDFGSDQPRIIKNFILPEAKNLGSGRIILKFRFSIRPDGSVSKVFPIMKGDPDLELETMNLLRKWRFEKLSATEDQIDQKVEISFRPQ